MVWQAARAELGSPLWQSSKGFSIVVGGSYQGVGAGRSGLLLVLLTGCLLPRVAWAQECQEDEDCGHGFQCIHDSAGTSSVTGAGGSSMPECGDGICEGGSEDIESCPEDCDTIQYCAPAECTSDTDCAEGYECGEEIGSNSGFTSGGGSSGSVCGDGLCDSDESEQSCPEDCRTYRLCRVAQVQCETDEDCAEGFYCERPAGSNAVSVAVSSVDSGSDGSDGADSATSATPAQGSGGSAGTDDEPGVCLPEGTAGSGGNGSSNVATVAGDTSNGSGGDANATAAGSGAVGGESASANDSLSATGSDTDGAASDGAASDGGGGDGGGGDGGDEDGGCSCAVPGQAGRAGTLGVLLMALGVGLARRRFRAFGRG